MSNNQAAHELAFITAILDADRIIEALYEDHVGALYAEDCPEMRDRLRTAVARARRGDTPPHVGRDLTQIYKGVSFMLKDEAPFLQFADAVAFTFQRYKNKRPGGDRLYASLYGKPEFAIRHDHTIPVPAGSVIIPPQFDSAEKLDRLKRNFPGLLQNSMVGSMPEKR